MFERYSVEPSAMHVRRTAPDWLAELARSSPSGEIKPGDGAPVLTGDPGDSRPIEPSSMRWGMPNLWMARKGRNPFDHPVSFMGIEQSQSPRGRRPAAGGWRCLVPMTSMVLDRDGTPTSFRDRDRPLLTLAGLAAGVGQDDDYRAGFCFLTMKVADRTPVLSVPLVVAGRHHDQWLSGWHRRDQVQSCCDPLDPSRLVRA